MKPNGARVLIVSCVFPPEPVVSASTSLDIAVELARRGSDVTVVTPFPSRPGGKLYPGFTRKLLLRTSDPRGFQIVRCFATLSKRSSGLSRFLENLSFGLTGGWAALTAALPDVIYSNTWPIFASMILALVARARGVPLVINVQDIYPESLIWQRRIKKGSFAARIMRLADRFLARSAVAVIAISERFAAVYRNERRVPIASVHMVPNWVDAARLASNPSRLYFRRKLGIPADAFLLVYSGNIGVAAGVETVIEAVACLPQDDPICLLIAGDGSNLSLCRSLAKKISGGRMFFHSPYPVEDTAGVLAAADVLVLPTRGKQSLASVPSKLIWYMLASRPVIALAVPQSDLAKIVEESNCGWTSEPDAPESLAARIREVMSSDTAELQRRGELGREFAMRNFTRDVCLQRVVEIIEDSASSVADRT